jgi:hypothetical protein
VARTGLPRAILNDQGVDRHGGVELFRHRHPQTIGVYDLAHKAACLLKARLERYPRWKSYTSPLGTTRFAIQQTKARFMNLEGGVGWGRRTLALVDDPSGLGRLGMSADRVGAKLGWLAEFREALGEWSGSIG